MSAETRSRSLRADLPNERPVPTLVLAVVAAEIVGAVGGIATASSVDTWYTTLTRPEFAPPNWVFAPVWITLFAFMGVAAWLVWRRADRPAHRTEARRALTVFGLQFAVNVAWSFAFFGARSPLAGLVVIAALWLLVGTTIVGFWRVDRRAAALMLPYIAWVSFAGLLNYGFWALN